jgi:type II secretion system protein D
MNLYPRLFHVRTLSVAALILFCAGKTYAQAQNQGARPGGQGGGVGAGGGGGGGGGGSTANGARQYTNSTMVGDAMITSDVDTRRLIIVTDDATNDNIRTIVSNLDKPKPQVLINVVFLQVTHDNDLDLGVEASYKGPISIKTNPDGIATTKFGVANQLADSTIAGAFYQLSGRDVNATIHALSTVNKTEILSRPSILTRSNQQATILVGQTVPLLNGSTVSDTGVVTNLIRYQDVGIILKVTPFITSDGLVEMILSPEISSISATTVTLTANVSSPVIDRRAADTVVVTQSDKTIVIGGLISNQNTDTDNKVPLLGDIPLVGNLFKRTTRNHTKTELLIFLTPHVVNTPAELAQLSDMERGLLEVAPKTFSKADIGKFLPAPGPLIVPSPAAPN